MSSIYPLAITNHRPWPLPRWPWVLAMQWHELLFAHWRVDPALLRPLIPAPLELQTFDGSAWLGVVPFRMAGVRPRFAPSVPWLSAFLELNVRTYVTAGGKAGVWFFSLDAANPVAVELARLFFHLPYFNARMHSTSTEQGIRYTSHRTHHGAHPAQLIGRYGPIGPVEHTQAGTLEHWLTERYCLYAADQRGHCWRGDIHHLPWPLQPATAELTFNTMTTPIGVELHGPPLLHYAKRLDVVAWLPEKIV